MSHWNYRVLKRNQAGGVEYVIVEAYYDNEGNLDGRTEDAVSPYGETVEELRQSLQWMLLALDKEVLEE